jgi:hypothetical protein
MHLSVSIPAVWYVKATVRLRCFVLERLKCVTYLSEQRLRNYHVIAAARAPDAGENKRFSGTKTDDSAGWRRKKG